MTDNEAVDGGGLSLHLAPDALPTCLQPLAHQLTELDPAETAMFAPPPGTIGRPSAVLILFADGADVARPDDPDVLLIERAVEMRSHAGQPAFPGGAVEPEDENPIATALREAQEETGLDPAGVTPFATLPNMWLPPSGFVVTPVIAWWQQPSPVKAADPVEVADVHRVRVADLVKPKNRVRVTHPAGFIGPGFMVDGMLVWGFTAMVLDKVLEIGQWTLPWEDDPRIVPFDNGWRPAE